MWTLLMIAAGVLIGWNLPQPERAKKVQAKIVAWARGIYAGWK